MNAASEGCGTVTGDYSALELFARELQAARARAGMSRDMLAGELRYSLSLVGHVETCRRVPSLDFARGCDRVFGMPGTFERMHDFLRTAPFPAWFRPFVDYEAQAKSLRWFEHTLVPGLLQTEDYAHAVLATRPNSTSEQVADMVSARMGRQEVLNRDDPPLLWIVMDEAALHRAVGSSKVMQQQLFRLADLSERPNVNVEVIPYAAGAHSGLLGAFIIADSDDAPAVAYMETAGGGQIAEDRSVVDSLTLVFDSLRSEALPWRASRDLIMKVAEQQWT